MRSEESAPTLTTTGVVRRPSSSSSRKRPRHPAVAATSTSSASRSTMSNTSRVGYGALRSLFDGDDGPSSSSPAPQPRRRRRSEDGSASSSVLPCSTSSPHGRVRRRPPRETSPGETTNHPPPADDMIDDATLEGKEEGVDEEEDEEVAPTSCPTGAPTGKPDRQRQDPPPQRRRIAPQWVASLPPSRSIPTTTTTTTAAAGSPPPDGHRNGTVDPSPRKRSPPPQNRRNTRQENPTGEASSSSEATGDSQGTGGGDTSSDDNDDDYVDDDTWKSLVPGAESTGETFYDDGTGTKPVHSSTIRFGLQVLEEERKTVVARHRASATQQRRTSRTSPVAPTPSLSLQRVSSEIWTAVRDRLRHQPLPGVYVRLEDPCTDQLGATTRDRRDASRVGHARALRLARHGTRLGKTRNRLWEEVNELEQRMAQPVDPYRLHPRLRASEEDGRPSAIGTTPASAVGGAGNQPFVRPMRFRPAPKGTLKLVLQKWRQEGGTVD